MTGDTFVPFSGVGLEAENKRLLALVDEQEKANVGPASPRQLAIDAATKPLDVRIEALTAERDALQAQLREALAVLKDLVAHSSYVCDCYPLQPAECLWCGATTRAKSSSSTSASQTPETPQ